jgi:hypothetical protein
MHCSIWCMREMYSVVCMFNIFSDSFKIFGLQIFLVLSDGGCLNALLPTYLFPSTSTHLFWDQDLESLLVPWGFQSSV